MGRRKKQQHAIGFFVPRYYEDMVFYFNTI